MADRSGVSIALTVLVVLVSGVLMLALLNRRDEDVAPGQEIRYDDFAFAVQESRALESLGEDPSAPRAQGVFQLVTLSLVNHASRVDCRLADFTPLLVDAAGVDHAVDEDALRFLAERRGSADPCAGAVPAGASCTTELVFDVPRDAGELHLRISCGGTRITDLLDCAFFGRKTMRLR